MKLYIQVTPQGIVAVPSEAGTSIGVGNNVAEAIGNALIANPGTYAVSEVLYDVNEPATKVHTQQLGLPTTISKCRGVLVMRL